MTVEIILIGLLLLGAVVLYMPDIRLACDVAGQRIKLSLSGFKAKDIGQIKYGEGEAGLNESIRRLLQITFGIGHPRAVAVFWIVSLIPPLILFMVVKGRASSLPVIGLCIFTAALPSLLMLGRLQTLRISSSREGKILLTELIDNYKINYFNMQQAVEITAANIEEAPNCRRLLFNLSKGLNRASGSREIKALLNDFKFSIGTSWASVLADNMYFALSSGIKVHSAMEDLLKTVAKAEEVEERANRENNEAGLILKYLAPICYLLTVIGGIRYFGLTAEKFLTYQFKTAAGLGWFIMSAFTYAAGIMAKRFLTRSKLDL